MENCYSYEDLNASFFENMNKDNFDKYKDVLEKQGKKGEFNLFEVISPKKRLHENVHSNILKFLLESYPDFFSNFLVLIGAKENYQSRIIECETDRIDITIKGEKHVIIIENKLNWAGDQDNQIYRYYKKMKDERKLEVDKIVYLSPSKYKEASANSLGVGAKETATKQEYIKDIRAKLITLVGFNGSDGNEKEDFSCLKNGEMRILKNDLVSCLEKIKKDSLSEDKRVFLNHYIEILRQTGAGDMSEIARKFLEEIQKNPEILKKNSYINNMRSQISVIWRDFWLTNFKGSSQWAGEDFYCKDYKKNDVTYYIAVIIEDLDVTRVIISNRYDGGNAKDLTKKRKYDEELKEILDSNKLGELEKGTDKDAWYKDFDFPTQDDAVLEFVQKVDAILSNLKTD